MAAPPAPETRRLTEIVIDMLSSGLADEEILTNLQQSGLQKQKAKEVLDTAKEQFTQFTSKKLGGVVEKLTGEKLVRGLEDIRKDLSLKIDLKAMESKGYTDKKIDGINAELISVKSGLTDLKIGVDAKLKAALQTGQSFQTISMTQKLLAVGIILAGVVSLILLVIYIPAFIDWITHNEPLNANFMLYLLVIVLLAVVAVVGFMFGGKALSSSRRYEEVGLEWMQKER